MSIYRQFEWVNGVKYKRSEVAYLCGGRGRLITLKSPFGDSVFKETGVENAFLDLFFMSPLCRHLHNQLLSAHV